MHEIVLLLIKQFITSTFVFLDGCLHDKINTDLVFLLQLHLLEIGLNNILQISFTKILLFEISKRSTSASLSANASYSVSHSITATCRFSALAFCPTSNNSKGLYYYLSDTFIGAKYIMLTIPSCKKFYVASII